MPIVISVCVLLPKHPGNHGPHVDRLSELNAHTCSHTQAAKIVRPSIKGKTIVAILVLRLFSDITGVPGQGSAIRTEGWTLLDASWKWQADRCMKRLRRRVKTERYCCWTKRLNVNYSFLNPIFNWQSYPTVDLHDGKNMSSSLIHHTPEQCFFFFLFTSVVFSLFKGTWIIKIDMTLKFTILLILMRSSGFLAQAGSSTSQTVILSSLVPRL